MKEPDRKLEVVVVAYGDAAPLRRCLASLGRGLPLTVVDNSSSPANRAAAEEAGARYVDPGRNVGFGAGVNLALGERLAPGGDVLLLNPDATVDDAVVEGLRRALAGDPALACVAPAQVDARGLAPSRVCWPFPSPVGAWVDALGLGRFRRRCDFVIGSVLLISGLAIEDVGLLDERFFLYAEETDWQRRARSHGWRSSLVPTVTAMHVGGGTGGDPERRETHFHASQERYIRKHHGRVGWQVYRSAVLVGSLLRYVAGKGERRQAAAGRLRRYLRGPVRCEAHLPAPAGGKVVR